LNALRAFEAAFRLGSFAQAAEELSVTPGAISQHIRSLEEWLGADLFRRRSQGVDPTELTQSIGPELVAAFDAMGAAVQGMRAAAGQSQIHIAALPSVAQLWLSPHLPAIREALPGVMVSVSALEHPPNLSREMFDLSVFLRRTTGDPAQLLLAQDQILPVCAPQLATRLQRPLLHDALWADDWGRWARSVLGDDSGFDGGAQYSLYALAVQDAVQGAGILMGHACLVAPELARGDLVAPFDAPVPTDLALVLEVTEGQLPASVETVVRYFSE